MKTYLFYDTETSGLNPAFDQILTFAAIRTDLSLKEIDRHQVAVRLRPDIVPSPGAFMTHGLTPEDLERGLSEYDAALKIHKILNTSGTISLGYNTLGFDDEFLRFLFYRNLLDPYTHQYNNGCARMDILPVTVIYRLFKPDVLKWPYIDGRPSLKLENISKENDFEIAGRAHEAMNDVEAVIALSRRLYKIRDSWDYAVDFFNKTRDEVRIANINKEFTAGRHTFRIGLMVSAAFGSDCNYMAPVIELGPSRPYKNQTLWLRLDSEDILGINEDLDIDAIFVIRKRGGDEQIILPALGRFREKLVPARRQLAADNLQVLKCHSDRFLRIIDYHCNYKYPYLPEMDLDAALYQDGFFSREEKKDIGKFHQAVSSKQFDRIEEIRSKRIKKLADRILFRNFPGMGEPPLGEQDTIHMDKLRSDKPEDQIVGFRNDSKLNVKKAFMELEEIKAQNQSLPQEKRKILEWLEAYLTGL